MPARRKAEINREKWSSEWMMVKSTVNLSNLTEVLDHHIVALENMLYAMTFTDDTPSSSVHLFQSVFCCGKVTGDSPVVFFKEQFVYGHSVIVWSRHFCITFLN